MRLRYRTATAVAALWALAGCATVNIDAALADSTTRLGAFSDAKPELSRTEDQRAAREQLAAELLARPLERDAAVQLAMANSPQFQAVLAQSWGALADAAQAGRIANPVFSFERMRLGAEVEIGRLLTFGLVDVFTLPQRAALARARTNQAQIELSLAIVDQVSQVRQAWVRAVASSQQLAYARQVQQAAEASAELARRMQQVGNFTKLQRARQQVFYADATAQLASASHTALAAREELVRQLGLTAQQAERLRLPDQLPALPREPRSTSEVRSAAVEQRLDVAMARGQLDAAGRAQGINLLTSFVDVEVGVRRDTVFDNNEGTRGTRRGFELDLRLPLFDWGDARRAGLNAASLAAANRYEATVRNASSQLRESYSAYRTAHDLALHYRDEIVPLRKTISEENMLRYNGMFIGVFELLADTREQIATVMAAINAEQQFWLADAALAANVIGRPMVAGSATPAAAGAAAGGDAPH